MNNTLTWACIEHKPLTWGFGIMSDDGKDMTKIKAYVFKQICGSWAWVLTGLIDSGIEPNRIEAMKTAEKSLLQSAGE